SDNRWRASYSTFQGDELEHLRQYGRKSLNMTAAHGDHPELQVKKMYCLYVYVQVLLFNR
ncbi:hypothetical protein, partial [Psychrobacter sp. CAL346-MNA-CIBAN-0220]|uniref:hypothetical protein n=1 Tax=Psychrobacter sp. CAL346-MNA-CIBAN-0220 TaxID=3140457 RepID=UPI00332134DE